MDSETPSRWQDIRATADRIGQAGHRLTAGGRKHLAVAEVAEARDALLIVTSTAARLARQLDTLAAGYESPYAAEPSAAQVALDQAAAAAEDLGNCAKVAAQAIQENE